MKKIRRFAAMVAAMALAACAVMPVMAFAAEDSAASHEITIGGPDAFTDGTIDPDAAQKDSDNYVILTPSTDEGEHSYEIIQIFTGEYREEEGTYADADGNKKEGILANVEWGSGIKGDGYDLSVELIAAFAAESDKTGSVFYGKFPEKEGGYSAEDAAIILSEICDGHDDNDATAKAIAQVIGDVINTAEEAQYITRTIANAGASTFVNDGYYFIQDEDGSPTAGQGANSGAKTKYILRAYGNHDAEGGFTVYAKSSAPEVMKKVYEPDYEATQGETGDKVTFGNAENGSGTYADNYELEKGYNDIADYSIGSNVPFELYGTLPSNLADYAGYFYQFEDSLGREFTLNEHSIEVCIELKEDYKDPETDETIIAAGKYIVENNDVYQVVQENPDYTHFTVTFDNIKTGVLAKKDGEGDAIDISAALNDKSVVTVKYTARLNENAVLGKPAQRNKVKINYSNNPNATGDGYKEETGKTIEDGVIVFTYGFDLDKWTQAGENRKALEKAQFIISRTFKAGDKVVTADGETEITEGATYYAKLVAITRPEDALPAALIPHYYYEEPPIEIVKGPALKSAGGPMDNGVNYTVVWTTDKPTAQNDLAEAENWGKDQAYALAADNGIFATYFESIDGDFTNMQEPATYNDDQIAVIPFAYGLDAGEYTITEIAAPEGYSLAAPITFTIQPTYVQNRQEVAYTESAATVASLNLENDMSCVLTALEIKGTTAAAVIDNNSLDGDKLETLGWGSFSIEDRPGAQLPSTGGIGTKLFVVGGGLAAAMAGVYLVSRKKAKDESAE